MQNSETLTIILTAIQVLILIFTAWFSLKRTKFQNVVDDSQASINYRNIVVALQAEVKESRAETKEIKALLENSHLDVKLSIQIGEAPVIKEWEWKKVEVESKTAPIM